MGRGRRGRCGRGDPGTVLSAARAGRFRGNAAERPGRRRSRLVPCRRSEECGQSGSVEGGFGTSWLLAAYLRGRPYDGIMHSDAIDVDSYLTQVPEARRAVLTEIRDACR